ncbi:MAG: PqqD family protein [Firmicutes bacterium]|nr:PqqD family protein [Bacillota bacterium]
MKLKNGIVMTEANGEFYAVDAGMANSSFNGMLRLNKTAAFVVKQLENECHPDDIVSAMLEKYDVDADTAGKNVLEVVETLRTVGFLDE